MGLLGAVIVAGWAVSSLVVVAAAVPTATTCYSSALVSPTAVTAFNPQRGIATKDYDYKAYFHIPAPFNPARNEHAGPFLSAGVGGDLYDDTGDSYYAYYRYIYYNWNFTIQKGKPHGIFYSIEGAKPHRTINIEWKLGNTQYPGSTWHFGIQFYERKYFLRQKYWHIPFDPDALISVQQYRDYYSAGNYEGRNDPYDVSYIHSGSVLLLNLVHYRNGTENACAYKGRR